MDIVTLTLPTHWACALINGDESAIDEDEIEALDAFTDDMVATYGQCHCLDVGDDQGFMKYHDAQPFGVLACEASEFTFDVTKREG